MNFIGKKAPSFYADGTKGSIYFPKDANDYWSVIYFYQSDFDPASATDILALDSKIPKFKSHNANVIAISPDSLPSHIAFVLSLQNMNKGKVSDFEILSDIGHRVSELYEISNKDSDPHQNEKGVVIVDPDGIIRSYHKYSTNMGLNVTEIERELVSLQAAFNKNAIAPAGWTPGDDMLNYPPKTVASAKTNMSEREKAGDYCLDWYICYKMI